MQTPKEIEHKGIVKNLTSHGLIVSIIAKSACISCQAKGICSVSDMEEKEIEVKHPSPSNFKTGEDVMVYYRQALGFRALFLGYLLPFIILMVVLIGLTATGFGELQAGLTALAAIVPYYLILYLIRNKLRSTFTFAVKKPENYQLTTKDIVLFNN